MRFGIEPLLMQSIAVPFALCSVWFMIAWAIDKFWFTVVCAQCSALFGFEFSLKARDLLTVTTDRVSAVFLFVLPFVAYAIYLIPFKNLKSSTAWSAALQKWSRPFLWLALVAMWVWGIESLYAMFSSSLPAWFKSYAEGYQLKLSGTILGVREVTVDGKLGGLFGLVLGIYLFLSKGMK